MQNSDWLQVRVLRLGHYALARYTMHVPIFERTERVNELERDCIFSAPPHHGNPPLAPRVPVPLWPLPGRSDIRAAWFLCRRLRSAPAFGAYRADLPRRLPLG